jgi:adenosylcobyric acid synthase
LQNFTNTKTSFDYKAYKEENYDTLATLLEKNIDIDSIISEMHIIS